MADARKLDQLTILTVGRKNPPGGGIDSCVARTPDEQYRKIGYLWQRTLQIVEVMVPGPKGVKYVIAAAGSRLRFGVAFDGAARDATRIAVKPAHYSTVCERQTRHAPSQEVCDSCPAEKRCQFTAVS